MISYLFQYMLTFLFICLLRFGNFITRPCCLGIYPSCKSIDIVLPQATKHERCRRDGKGFWSEGSHWHRVCGNRIVRTTGESFFILFGDRNRSILAYRLTLMEAFLTSKHLQQDIIIRARTHKYAWTYKNDCPRSFF